VRSNVYDLSRGIRKVVNSVQTESGERHGARAPRGKVKIIGYCTFRAGNGDGMGNERRFIENEVSEWKKKK